MRNETELFATSRRPYSTQWTVTGNIPIANKITNIAKNLVGKADVSVGKLVCRQQCSEPLDRILWSDVVRCRRELCQGLLNEVCQDSRHISLNMPSQ